MSYISVDSRWRLFGEEGWRVSLNLDKALIRSALIYDDRLVILYRTPDGHNAEMNMGLWPGYQDVMAAIRVRARDSDDQSGWSYLRLSYAGGEPDLTPQKIKGTKGDDVLYGGFGADVIKGGKGDDILHGERVADNHWVGGNDRLDGSKRDDVLNGGIGADRLDGGAGDDQLDGGDGADVIRGGSGDDVISGGSGKDILSGGEGADIFKLFSLAEQKKHDWDEVTDFELGIDRVQVDEARQAHIKYEFFLDQAGEHVSYVLLTDWVSMIIDDPFYHRTTVTYVDMAMKIEFADLSLSAFGDLLARAGGLKELITKGLPKYHYPDGAIIGTDGDDLLNGTPDDDAIYGLGGNDLLNGVEGNDRLYGGDGNDRLMGHRGDELLDGGSGDDTLAGHDGNDRLDGGAGNDFLAGGADNDILTGGAGADIFNIALDRTPTRNFPEGEPNPNHDQVTDFEVGIDKIGLSAKNYAHHGLNIRTLAQESGDLIGLVVQINGHEANNSLTVAFTEHFSTAEFNELVDEAGSLNELLLEVV